MEALGGEPKVLVAIRAPSRLLNSISLADQTLPKKRFGMLDTGLIRRSCNSDTTCNFSRGDDCVFWCLTFQRANIYIDKAWNQDCV